MSTSSETLQRALQLHQSGQFQQAEALYRTVLESEPNNTDAHHLLGLAALALGQVAVAVEHIRTAVDFGPAPAEFHHHLGAAYEAAGSHVEAIRSYREAIRLNPRAATAHVDLGNLLTAQSQRPEAEICYREAIRLEPGYAEAHNNLGNILQYQQRFDEAIVSFAEAARLRPQLPEIHFNLGNCYRSQKMYAAAAAAYRRALALKRDFPVAYHNLGAVLQSDDKYVEAAECHRQAIALKPDYVDAYNGLGASLHALERIAEAKSCYLRALELKPDDVTAQFNLGTAFHAEGKYAEAEAKYRLALDAVPDHADSLAGLGMICATRGDLASAMDYQQRVIRGLPENPEAHFAVGTMLLKQGAMLPGWKEFEYRLQCKHVAKRSFSEPRWDGSPLAGRTLLVYAEFGFGDTLQFIRYMPMLRQRTRDGKLLIEVHGNLIPLFEDSGFRDLLTRGNALPHFDLQVAMMSVPRIFETTLETIPQSIPYVFANSKLTKQWQNRLSEIEGFKIGIHWQGNQKYGADRHRSIPLSCFAHLAQLPGVRLISLQKEAGTEQISQVAEPFPLTVFDNFDEAHGPFMDSAALIKNLDLVITSDSAVAHLAGAMGAKVWLALGVSSEWRWLVDREDSPWYPTMRLFRQSQLDDWKELFTRIAAEVAKLVEKAGRR